VIRGQVVELQARIGVIFRLPGQPDLEIECVVDTGFEGALTLPPAAVSALAVTLVCYSATHRRPGARTITSVQP
jgi:predicted aspartyl protease